MSGQLAGKVAIVTGGSRGIGLGIAKRFVEEGARVVTTARRALKDKAPERSDVLFVAADVPTHRMLLTSSGGHSSVLVAWISW